MNLKLIIDNLRFSYEKQHILIVDNYDIQGPGIFIIHGKSGSGKSTLLRLINGELKPQNGEVYLSHNSILLPQDVKIIGETARELFSLISGKTVFNKDKISQDFNLDFLNEKEFGWDHTIGTQARKLSGGEIKRLLIASVMHNDAPIILLDEPSSALDENNKKILFNSLDQYAHNKLIICTTHDTEIISKYSDRLLEVKNGCVR